LQAGDKLIQQDPNRFIFLGEKPRFPNHNLGWITVGEKLDTQDGFPVLKFKSWKYRPDLELCKKMFSSGKSLWNPGYFITSVDFVIDLYKKHKPEMYTALQEIVDKPEKMDDMYPALESISFDDAIVEKTSPEQAIVLAVDMGWSEPGTLYALKEALQASKEANVTKGKTYELDTKDSLIFNFEDDKLVATVGLDGFVVINMKDALIVVHKDDVPKVKKLVNKLEKAGLAEYI
jgi:mannose-1-phosphate guanylyltransferase